jgi:hypothetical protein
MSTSESILEKATYRKSMKADCSKWRKMLKKNQVSMADAHNAFNEKYPEVISYDGFYKAVNHGGFGYKNYQKAKEFFTELENRLN